MRFFVPLILFAAGACFALGLTLPLLRVERLWLFAEEPSLLAIVGTLWTGGEVLLAAIVAAFSIAFPAAKLSLLHVAAYGPGEHAALPSWMKAVANWSMLDVVLVALVIFAAKTSGLASAVTLPGLWFFAASAVLTATASALLRKA